MYTAIGLPIKINSSPSRICLTIQNIVVQDHDGKPNLPDNTLLLVSEKSDNDTTIGNFFNGVYDKQIIGIDYEDHVYKCSVGYIRQLLVEGIHNREKNPQQKDICDLDLPKITMAE